MLLGFRKRHNGFVCPTDGDYPGEYSYKYPKAGQDNSKVSLWSYDMKNGKTVALDVPSTLFPMVGWRLPWSLPVPPRVTP